MTTKQLKQRFIDNGYGVEKVGHKWAVTMPNGRTYNYGGSLVDIAKRVGVITSEEATGTSKTDKRHVLRSLPVDKQ